MAYITTPELRDRLPLEAQGVSESEVGQSIASAIEFVVARTGDVEGESAMLRDAVGKLSYADIWEIIFGLDVRATDSTAVVLRKQADLLIMRYLEWKADVDQDPLTMGENIGYVIEAPF